MGKSSPKAIAAAVLVIATLAVPVAASAGVAGPLRPTKPRIIGGDIAPAGSWPSVVGILEVSSSGRVLGQVCGGTVVSPTWVLTSAHCMTDLTTRQPVSPQARQVLVGTQDLRSGGARIGVDDIRIDPSFDLLQVRHDVALLHLKRPTGASVMPLGAPEDLPAADAPLSLAGWGETATLPQPARLRQVTVSAVSDADCTALLAQAHQTDPRVPTFHAPSQVCTGPIGSGGVGPCFRDNGGPLVNDAGGRRVQVGVVSFAVSCASPEFPAVYARVTALRPWIDGVLKYGPDKTARQFVILNSLAYFNLDFTEQEITRDTALLEAGLDPGTYLAGVQGSDDVQRRDGALARLYRAILGRTPDAFGWAYWRIRLVSGLYDLSHVAAVMASSSEFRTRYGGLDNLGYVQLLYQNVLGRAGEPGGVAYWTGRLDRGVATRADVALGLALSPENVTRTQKPVDVQVAYLDLLHRPPSDVALLTWSSRPLNELLTNLVHSYTYAVVQARAGEP